MTASDESCFSWNYQLEERKKLELRKSVPIWKYWRKIILKWSKVWNFHITVIVCFLTIVTGVSDFCFFFNLYHLFGQGHIFCSFLCQGAFFHFTQKTKTPTSCEGGRTKEPILNETKSPILQTGQNRLFQKWDKPADFENETERPISKMRQNRRFCKRTNCYQNCFTDKSVLA